MVMVMRIHRNFRVRIRRCEACFLAAGVLLGAVRGEDTAEAGKAEDGASKVSPATADDEPIPSLDISRRSLDNFLEDDVALAPHSDGSGKARRFADVFMVGSDEARHAIVWDPVSCRSAGVLDLEAPPPKPPQDPEQPEETRGDDDSDEEGVDTKEGPPSPYVLRAEGPAPFTGCIGAFGQPEYFGFRLVDGRPEFLYTHGALAIEERLWLAGGGDLLEQRIVVREPENDLLLTLPAVWKERAESSAGQWSENTLSVPVEAAAKGVTLTYRLSETENPATDEGE